MDQLRANARLLFTTLFISQICGTPTFYWSQPDCYQQNIDTYGDSSQGTNYQETLQAMIEETLKAISEIIQVTARATKKELAELTKIFYQKFANSCNTFYGNDEFSGDYQLSDPPGPEQYQGQPIDSDYTNRIKPQYGDPAEMGVAVISSDKKTSAEVTTLTVDKNTGIENYEISSVSPVAGEFANNQNSLGSKPSSAKHKTILSTSSARPNLANKTSGYLNTTYTGGKPNETTSVTLLADELATLSLTTGETKTEYTTETFPVTATTSDEQTLESTTDKVTTNKLGMPNYYEIFHW